MVGNAYNAGSAITSHGFLWQDGAMTDLGSLPGYTDSLANAINTFGQVVGMAFTLAGNQRTSMHAFLWQGGVMADLNNLIPAGSAWELFDARGINDAGQIVGSGKVNGGSELHGYLLTPTVPRSEYFPQTGKAVQGPFLTYWREHGGLAINGFPISAPFVEALEGGKVYLVQYFERVRMEYHPENAAPYDVLLGQFGRILHPADPAVSADSSMTFYPQTGHNVPADFQAFWDANGGLAQLGYPLSEVITEQLEDGNVYAVQYFERARFERHPANAPPNNIELGQFGRRILGR